MLIAISKSKLLNLVLTQLRNFFGVEGVDGETADVFSDVLEHCEHCFSCQRNKYYRKDGRVYFNPFHGGQYAIFLYFLSRQFFLHGHRQFADAVYCLNRALHSVDLYYEVALPSIFGLDHPLGSVLGRAEYSDYFYFTQHCTVGNNRGVYPKFGSNVSLLAGAMVIGSSVVGRNCIISAGVYVKDQCIPSNSIVFGRSPDIVIKRMDDVYFESNSFFNERFR